MFVISGKPLIYFLTDRVSPVQDLEYMIYLTAFDSIREERAREFVDEDELIRRLDEARPLIVDDSIDDGGKNVRRMYPRLAQFVSTHYRLEKRFGKFWVLSRIPNSALP